MKVVRTSEIFNMLQIPALGKHSNGTKLRTGTEPCFVKERGKYMFMNKPMNYLIVLEYTNKDWIIQLSNSEDCDNIYLAAINVFDKGKGIGTELMNTILDHCDEIGKKLFLHPFPIEYTKEKYNPKKALNGFYRLRDWYKSFGMEEQSDGYMVYNPQ